MTPFGDAAVRFAVPSSIAQRRTLLSRLRDLPGVRDVVLCEELGCVVFEDGADRSLLRAAVEQPIPQTVEAATTKHVVRVVYDGEDLATLGLAREDVVRLHTAGDYHVSMLGFLPGFAYLRGLPAELCLPRRAPRPRVPAHSVAIGAEYTGIYPVASAGGWHLLGRALDTPRFELGDRVRFEAARADATSGEAPREEPIASPSGAHLIVTRMAGLALFVDHGRAGQMHRGMPPGGPLVRSAFERANGWVGNEVLLDPAPRVRGIPWLHRSRGPETIATPCAIELTGTMEVEARGGALRVAAAEPITLREGERLTLSSGARRVAYLAIEGGFDAPIIDRSRNALLGAGIGRPLRRGEILQCRSAADAARGATAPAPRSREPGISALPNSALGAEQDLRAALCAADEVVLRAGPDLDDELRAQIEAAAFTISPTSDRAGTRLTGPALRASAVRLASTPMIEGAIELTPSGLVVLGPDHPTTGGYPVPAVLASESRDAFFALPLGAAVRFVFGDDA